MRNRPDDTRLLRLWDHPSIQLYIEGRDIIFNLEWSPSGIQGEH